MHIKSSAGCSSFFPEKYYIWIHSLPLYEACEKSDWKKLPEDKIGVRWKKKRYKWGKYGIGKYIYQKDEEEEIKSHLYGYMK